MSLHRLKSSEEDYSNKSSEDLLKKITFRTGLANKIDLLKGKSLALEASSSEAKLFSPLRLQSKDYERKKGINS